MIYDLSDSADLDSEDVMTMNFNAPERDSSMHALDITLHQKNNAPDLSEMLVENCDLTVRKNPCFFLWKKIR